MTLHDLGDLIIWLGAVAAALTAIALVVRRVVVTPLKNWISEQIREPVTAIRAELSYNHGTSMKDAVHRTELKLDELATRLDTHIGEHIGGGAHFDD